MTVRSIVGRDGRFILCITVGVPIPPHGLSKVTGSVGGIDGDPALNRIGPRPTQTVDGFWQAL